jgi:hypothetical protein
MPDMRTCAVCPKEFDFDTSGLEGPGGIVVCSAACAKKSAKSRGREHAIHDKEGRITESNITPGPKIHHW